MKGISKVTYYSPEQFIKDVECYIKAIKERRMICIIESVSHSGMSRNMKFHSCEKTKTGFYYRNYYAMFKALGYTAVRDRDSFRINGCGMDMVFHTNYSNIHDFKRMGFITETTCKTLAQSTPTVL